MIEEVVNSKQLRHRWVACDEAFGVDTTFLDKVDVLGLWYFAEASCNTRFWLQRPETEVPAKKEGRGRTPTRARCREGEPKAQEAHKIAEQLPPEVWTRKLSKLQHSMY